MQDSTREQLLGAAKRQFAERGFYGASIARVAGDVGLTKQALLYYFKRKEDLYAEVLQEISRTLLRLVRSCIHRDDAPERQLEDVLLGLYYASRDNPLDTQILVRELLDNQARAKKANDWYLLPFLGEIAGIAQRIKGFEGVPASTVFCMVYQLLGGIQYFAISTATLTRMYGDDTYAGFRDDFSMALRCQVRRLVDSHRQA